MYTGKSAEIYDAIYAFLDYDEAARRLQAIVDEHAPGARRLLDVACGTGRQLEALAGRFEVEGLDLNEDLLELARRRCPDAPLHVADMTDFSLGSTYDVISCLFSSIAYARTTEKLRSTLASMTEHLAPGGLLVVEPWFTPESFWSGTITMNTVDEPERKIAWMYTSEAVDGLSVLDVHYLVGSPEGIDRFEERHEYGLFTDEQYRGAIEAAGLRAEHREGGVLVERGVYLGLA